jgi:integrase
MSALARAFFLSLAVAPALDAACAGEYIHGSIAEATRRAYLFDIAYFEQWGGRIPCDPNDLAAYLAECAATLAVATLVRRCAAIARAHHARGVPSPTRAEVVRATLRGIRRRCGTAQREARPLLRDELFRTLDSIGDSMKDARDRALLLVGFAAGFRRSEFIGLDVPDVEIVPQGLVIHLRRSKTDQDGAGRKIGVPFGRTRFCPVTALGLWREQSGIAEGPLFRPVDRYGRIATERLSGEAISVIVKARVAAAGYDPATYSGHSLRAGLATSAAQAGVAPWRIRQTTGHASDAMLSRYIRDGEMFVGNAAGALL